MEGQIERSTVKNLEVAFCYLLMNHTMPVSDSSPAFVKIYSIYSFDVQENYFCTGERTI